MCQSPGYPWGLCSFPSVDRPIYFYLARHLYASFRGWEAEERDQRPRHYSLVSKNVGPQPCPSPKEETHTPKLVSENIFIKDRWGHSILESLFSAIVERAGQDPGTSRNQGDVNS